jgi:hypothetical protein
LSIPEKSFLATRAWFLSSQRWTWDDLDRVRAGGQELGEQRIGIERNRGEQPLEFFAGEETVCRRLFGLDWGRRLGLSWRGRRGRGWVLLGLGKQRVRGQGCGERQSE